MGTIKSLMLYNQIQAYYKELNGLKRAIHALPEVQFRQIIQPSKPLSKSYFSVMASEEEIRQMIDQGEADFIHKNFEREGEKSFLQLKF